MKSKNYSMSFTTGSLFHQESVQLAALFLNLGNWENVREQVVSNNLLQSRTLNTLKRSTTEIISRLKTLSNEELSLLVNSIPQQQAYILWLAVCRRYRFIQEFAIEILRERYLTLKKDLPLEEFNTFFNLKSDWHESLNDIKPATRSKLRQTLYKMMKEAGLLTQDLKIQPALLSPELVRIVSRQSLVFFPASDSHLVGGLA
jgi:hypothetical protein